MPKDRDRERAKRRYAARQATLQQRELRRRRNQQIGGGVLAVVLVVGGVFALTKAVGGTAAPVKTAASTSRVTTSASPSATPSASPSKTYAKPSKTLAGGKQWKAVVTTNRGRLTLLLDGAKAPQTVSSFISLSRQHFYDRTACHRLTLATPLQVLQCGDPTGTGTGGPGYGYGIENAPADGRYPAGTLAMARTEDPNSNGSQFFIAWGDSTLPTTGGGYTIFGRVTKGLDVVTGVAKQGVTGGGSDGRPNEAIDIESIAVSPV